MFGLAMRSRDALAAVVSLAILGVASTGAMAQSTQPKDAPAAPAAKPAASGPVLIVIDGERIRRESLAGKSFAAEAEKYDKSFTDEDRKEEAPLHATDQELQKLRGTIPQEQFTEKARAFEQKVAEVQHMEAKRHQAFERSYNAANYKLQQAILEAAHDVATAHNADVVLQSQALLFYNTGWDVTNEVIDLLNKRVTKVDFPPPKIEPDAPGAAGATGATAEDPGSAKPAKQLQSAQPQQPLKLPQ
jgi:Skp family chaperone for outer membrane proteins